MVEEAIQLSPEQIAMILLAAGLAIVVVLASLVASRRDLYRASLIRTAFWLPGIVAVLTVILFLVLGADTPPEGLRTDGLLAVLFGTGLGVITWLLYALANQSFSKPESANSRSFSQLTTRVQLLGPAASPDSLTRLAEITARHDERWVLGTGYLDAWETLNGAEEMKLLTLPDTELVHEAFNDWLRLRGSNIPNSESMSEKTRMAAGSLVPAAYPYFLDPTGLAMVQLPTAAQTPDERDTAKQMIRGVRRAINVYREERYDRIIRARNQLLVTTMFTALVAYLGLALALLAGVSTTAVFAASAYFVVGAIVGLVVRLRTDSSKSVAMEDYGLSTARMLQTPLLSGLVGIAGVALIALAGLLGPVFASTFAGDMTALTPSAAPAPAASAPATPAPASPDPDAAERTAAEVAASTNPSVLVRVFDVGQFPVGLVIAAIFGFSPPLLFRGLQKNIDQYKLDLASSEASGSPQREQ